MVGRDIEEVATVDHSEVSEVVSEVLVVDCPVVVVPEEAGNVIKRKGI